MSTTIGVLTFGVGGNVTSTGLKKWGSYALKGFNAGGYSNLANQALTKGILNINPFETLFAGIGGSIAAPMAVKVGEMTINKFGNVETNVINEKSNKTVTNPNGKKGGPEHQAIIGNLKTKATLGDMVTEHKFDTPNGSKNYRCADAVEIINNEVANIYQVGKINKNGLPISREIRAINDIMNSPDYNGAPIEFIPYNLKSTSPIIYQP